MARQNISPSSYLNFSNLLELNGCLFWDETVLPEIPESFEDIFVQVQGVYALRPDLVAFDYYGDENLWWVILQANQIDLFNQMYVGLTVRVPARSTIDSLLNKK